MSSEEKFFEREKGILIVISGPSCAGKGTVCRIVRENRPEIRLSISETTRSPRNYEVPGKDYFFVTKEEFKQRIEPVSYTHLDVYKRQFFIWAQVFPASVLQIFRAEPAVISAGTAYLRTFSIDFMLVAFGFCFLGFFNGCGRTAFSMVNGVAASLLVRLPLAWILSVTLSGSLMAIGLAAPAATLVSVVAEIIYLRLGRWKTPVV